MASSTPQIEAGSPLLVPRSVAGFLESGPVACPLVPGLRSLAVEPQEVLVALTGASLGQEVHSLADSKCSVIGQPLRSHVLAAGGGIGVGKKWVLSGRGESHTCRLGSG